MTRCLGEKTLLLLSAGDGNSEHLLHLKTCEFCADRYQRMAQELEFVASTLRQEPPADEPTDRPIPLLYRAVPILAAFVFAVVLIWGESRFWRSNPGESSEELATSDLSQLLDQVSEALFPADAPRQMEITGSDLVSVQNALGENCSADCQELFANLINKPSAISKAE
jgi:hypothetical protein